ncbi:MAG: hypothetical protein F6K09_38955 [Merismopedia sp. SIO2A8]|nr:hypothetical protein [Symploca sp. SIO2B6]NET54370.1 hypothetical protein [Merismopedia sp. SIO2A8]
MARINPHTLQMQITRMFEHGQAIFATTKVQDWLRERGEDPSAYAIAFNEAPAPPGSDLVKVVTIQLKRYDGQPVDEWLQSEVNRHA